MHPQAFPAAQAFECAEKQGKAWPMYDALFQQHGELKSNQIQGVADNIKLDPHKFQEDYRSSSKAAVERDIQLGNKVGVHGTPTFFLCCPNRKVVRLYSVNQLENFLSAK